jgi:large conductance mechanosensitive channel
MDPLKSLGSLDPAKRAFSLWDEFKAFAFKGNVIDLAVGVIIGAAFGNIINSLVKNIVMPLISLVIPSDQAYTKWSFSMGDKEVPYGVFLGDVVNFLVIAVVLFVVIVKVLGWLMRARQQEVAAAPPMTKDQELLTEIRDLLQKNALSRT